MKVKLADIIEAIEFTNDDFEYFLDQKTGEVVMISDVTMEDEEIKEASEALEEHGCYRLPTQWELRDDDTMEAFVDVLSGPAQERLATAISGRGAFRRFKDEVRRLGIVEQWYAWDDDAYRRKAIEWCEENGIEYE